MQRIYQIPRNSLAWMLAAFASVIAPHIERLPLWITLTAGIALCWRVQVHRGVWRFPRPWIKYLLAGMGSLGLLIGYGRLAGLEPMVALLIIGYSLKLLEMHRRRDAVLVIYLAFFVAATQVLFAQSIAVAAYVALTYLLIVTALLGLNQDHSHQYPWQSLRLAGKLLLQALPVMLLLFILMPRLGALWSVPTQQNTAKTGVSDSMSPGDFSRLGRSGKLAFRVSFQGPVPDQSRLYWRGLVFSRFDGRQWRQAEPFDYARGRDGPMVRWHGDRAAAWESLIERNGRSVSYDVTLEPSHQPWLYSLAMLSATAPSTGLTRDFRLLNRLPVSSRLNYSVSSVLDYRTEVDPLPPWRIRNETRLPEGFNPRTRERASLLRAQSGSDSEYVDRILAWFNREFIYTLEPPLLGRHSVDEFLFDTRQGFCEHFASSFTVMMRAAGIPARVVVGYQGGETHPSQNYVLVHQFDAHAWTEVWLPGQGWTRVDPTAAVAPERIRSSAQSLFENEAGFLSDSPFSLLNYSNINLMNWLRLRMDMLDYNWQRWVLGYRKETQSRFLQRWLGGTDPYRIALAMVVLGGVILGVLILRILVKTKPQTESRETRAYRRFNRKLAKLGFVRKAGETPLAFARRVNRRRPDLAGQVDAITDLFITRSYAASEGGEALLESRVKEFRPIRRP